MRLIPPGKVLQTDLKARGWGISELAEYSGLPATTIEGVCNATRRVDLEIALGLSKALGTTKDYWLGLEAQYQHSLSMSKGS